MGPNVTGNTSAVTAMPGDILLETLIPQTTYDACVIEFDFVTCASTFDLTYLFASEVYPELVSSNYLDVFSIFLTGPNPFGNSYYNHYLTVIPGSTVPVSINSINSTNNQAYYNHNMGTSSICFDAIEFDGFIDPFVASANIIPCETYHLKIAIADAEDQNYDSGLFIAHPMNNSATTVGATVNNETCYGAANGSIYIDSIVGNSPLTYEWSTGSQEDSIVNLNVGTYTLTVVDAQNLYSVHTFEVSTDTMEVSLTATPINLSVSPFGSIVATITGGMSPFTFDWSNGATTGDSIDAGYGPHSLVLTDAAGCTDTAETFVNLATTPHWTVQETNIQHVIRIPESAFLYTGLPQELYDFIGVFYSDGSSYKCAGYMIW